MTTTIARRTAPVLAREGQLIEGPLGIKINGLAFGDPAAEHKLVFIHGGLQAWPCFRKQYEALAGRDCYVVTFDLPWHGLSGPSAAQPGILPTAELWAASLEAVLRHFNLLQERVTLLAWSMGGLVIHSYLLLKDTAHLAGLVAVAALLDAPSFFPMVQRELPEAMGVMGRLMNAELPASAQQAALLEFVDRLWWVPPSSEQYYLTLGYNARGAVSAAPCWQVPMETQAPGDTRALLARLPCPVLLVQGLRDALVPPTYTRQFAQMLPPGQVRLLELPDCGHSPFLEQSEAFNATLLEFLRGPVRRFMAGSASLPA